MIEIDVDVIHHGSEGSILEKDVTFRFFFLFFCVNSTRSNLAYPALFHVRWIAKEKPDHFFKEEGGKESKWSFKKKLKISGSNRETSFVSVIFFCVCICVCVVVSLFEKFIHV